jgi:hypothetical protein
MTIHQNFIFSEWILTKTLSRLTGSVSQARRRVASAELETDEVPGYGAPLDQIC